MADRVFYTVCSTCVSYIKDIPLYCSTILTAISLCNSVSHTLMDVQVASALQVQDSPPSLSLTSHLILCTGRVARVRESTPN